MEKLKDLIKESFDLFVKQRWLNEINKAVNRYNKAKNQAAHERYVMQALIKEYNKLYNDKIFGEADGRANQKV